MCEIWKDVAGYEGLYQVSNFGQVRSLDRIGSNGVAQIVYKGCVLKPVRNKQNGYYHVTLHRNNVRHTHYVHRLVASAFVPNPMAKPEVNHLDEDKGNNAAANLEWCTRSENQRHNGLCRRTGLKRRGKVVNNKPIIQLTNDGVEVARYDSALSASRVTGVDFSSIRKVVRGQLRKAGGFVWKELEK